MALPLRRTEPTSAKPSVILNCLRFEKSGRFLFRHWTPNDNPILSEERKKELFDELSSSEYLLERDWYGHRVLPQGVIYAMFGKNNKATEIKGNIIETFFTADGGQADATTCAFWVVTITKESFICIV